MNRYALIETKMPREFVLLQGTGCRWRKCTFCDYHLDVSGDPFAVNREVLSRVTGQNAVLDVINSGSCVELDEQTLACIAETVELRNIKTLWFEAHWMYRNELHAFAERFPGAAMKFRTGIETFDAEMRSRWNKGVSADVTADDVARYFDGVCLLVGVEGQTRGSISRDIGIALERFEYFSVNVFAENSTDVRRDDELVAWFVREWSDRLAREPNVEVLLDNTDLGVG